MNKFVKVTVKELIEELSTCPADAIVTVMARRDIENGDADLDLDIDNCAREGHNEITINVY